MTDPSWTALFVKSLLDELSLTYERESYMMSFYYATEHLYGLPERVNKI